MSGIAFDTTRSQNQYKKKRSECFDYNVFWIRTYKCQNLLQSVKPYLDLFRIVKLIKVMPLDPDYKHRIWTRAHIKKSQKSKSSKIQIADLRNIVLPNTNDLQSTLAPWLISKSKYCDLINNERDDGNEEETSKQNRIIDNVSRTEKNEIQNVPGIDVSIQCQFPKNTSHKSAQVDPTSISCEKFTQCMVPNITIQTQTNGILTKSSKVQCCLPGDFDTQQKSKGVDKATQYYDTCENCKEIDCKCYIHNLVNIKHEPQLAITPVNLSPINSLIISPIKSISSTPSASTPITSLHVAKNTSANTTYCKICDKIGFSKDTYILHKKIHMTCSFCKKKFTSIKRTKYHIDNDCETKKRFDIPTVVQLIKVENLQEVQKNYSNCLENLKNYKRGRSKIRSLIRMRSRSTSSTDSLYSCCNFCRNCSVTVLHGIKIGVDKSVQTNLFDNQVDLGLVLNGDITFKSKLKNVGDLTSPAKKIKLSNSLIE